MVLQDIIDLRRSTRIPENDCLGKRLLTYLGGMFAGLSVRGSGSWVRVRGVTAGRGLAGWFRLGPSWLVGWWWLWVRGLAGPCWCVGVVVCLLVWFIC